MLTVNEPIWELAKAVWHTSATCALSLKRAEKYSVPSKGTEFLFSHSNLSYLLVQAVME